MEVNNNSVIQKGELTQAHTHTHKHTHTEREKVKKQDPVETSGERKICLSAVSRPYILAQRPGGFGNVIAGYGLEMSE